MSRIISRRVPMISSSTGQPSPTGAWVWDGYLAPGNITLLTSRWKTGKTTLLTGLLRGMAKGETFLGPRLAAGRALVLSEECSEVWTERLTRRPVGPHAEPLSRPDVARPRLEQTYILVDGGRRLAL